MSECQPQLIRNAGAWMPVQRDQQGSDCRTVVAHERCPAGPHAHAWSHCPLLISLSLSLSHQLHMTAAMQLCAHQLQAHWQRICQKHQSM